MNTDTKLFLKLRNQKSEDIYKIENINENILVSPLKPVINIFENLTLHYGENDECVGEFNFSEIFMSAISEAIDNKLGDSELRDEINKTLQSNMDSWFSEISDCFPKLEVINDEYVQPDIQQILNDPFAKKHNNPMRRTEPKVGRNDPCPCGSGKKYKQCCLK